jgi:hypothetical protein
MNPFQTQKRLVLAAFCASCMAFPAAAQMTASPTKAQVKAEYKNEKGACDALSDNDKDVCREKAKARKEVGMAQVKYDKDPSERSAHNLAKTRAESEYHVAKEMCDSQSGNAKDVCLKQAKANEVAAISAAKFVKKADAAAIDAIDDTAKAQYKVEVEKCDALSGSAKSTCVDRAKQHYKH